MTPVLRELHDEEMRQHFLRTTLRNSMLHDVILRHTCCRCDHVMNNRLITWLGLRHGRHLHLAPASWDALLEVSQCVHSTRALLHERERTTCCRYANIWWHAAQTHIPNHTSLTHTKFTHALKHVLAALRTITAISFKTACQMVPGVVKI